MSRIPAPLLSRQVGVVVLVLSVLAAAGLAAGASLGSGWLVAAIVLVAVQQAFLALAILLIGRTGLAGRHALVPVVATLGSAALLLLDALTAVIGVILAAVGALPSTGLVTPVAVGLTASTALLLVAFGIVVLRAAVVSPAVRALPLVAGLAVIAAGVAAILDPVVGLTAGAPVAVLLSGGIGLALFTPRPLR